MGSETIVVNTRNFSVERSIEVRLSKPNSKGGVCLLTRTTIKGQASDWIPLEIKWPRATQHLSDGSARGFAGILAQEAGRTPIISPEGQAQATAIREVTTQLYDIPEEDVDLTMDTGTGVLNQAFTSLQQQGFLTSANESEAVTRRMKKKRLISMCTPIHTPTDGLSRRASENRFGTNPHALKGSPVRVRTGFGNRSNRFGIRPPSDKIQRCNRRPSQDTLDLCTAMRMHDADSQSLSALQSGMSGLTMETMQPSITIPQTEADRQMCHNVLEKKFANAPEGLEHGKNVTTWQINDFESGKNLTAPYISRTKIWKGRDGTIIVPVFLSMWVRRPGGRKQKSSVDYNNKEHTVLYVIEDLFRITQQTLSLSAINTLCNAFAGDL